MQAGGWRSAFFEKKETSAQLFYRQFCVNYSTQVTAGSDVTQEREREREKADFNHNTKQPVRDDYENRSCTIISEILGVLLLKSSILL